MARVCDVCGKGKVFGNKISFSNRKSSKSWSPNLRSVKAVVNGSPKRIKVCTRCLRSGYVERAL
ncbi:MAG TPA: 50S ribosomal protein L28 [Tissierellaceae bacterium]|nr:50S ribosomal protein L28 [Tissierellaceae bacterium]